MNPLPQSDLGERTIDEVAQPRQAGFEHGSSAAADSDVAALQDVERSSCRVEKIPDLMREESDSFVRAGRFGFLARLIALSAELCDRARNRIVKAPVQRAEIIDVDRYRPLQCEVGDRLAHVAIVMDDLGDGESLQLKCPPVSRRAVVDLRVRRYLVTKCFDQLIEEYRCAVILFRRGGRRR